MTPNRTRGFKSMVARLAAVATVATLAVAGPVAAQADDEGIEERSSALNGFRNVGYFAQWGVYGRGFKLHQLDKSGAAANLTHINYSFGNIHHQTLECFIANKAQGTGPNGSDGAGDAWADFGMGYTEADSVAGVRDAWDQPLKGSFNQLKQLKAKHPNLKVMISLGGWTWSKNFSRAAATDASRKKLVKSCVDLYLRGDLPVIDGAGGKGAAAGVFDGIDIDWEWPGTNNGEVGNYVDEVNDRENFRLLLKEFRTQLDALTAETGKPYQLSGFAPANPEDILGGGWNDPRNFESFDFVNIQGYDLHGAWDSGLTGHQGNLFADPNDPRPANKKFSVDKAVQMYLNEGIDPAQLGLGLAGYGRGWQGVSSANPWGSASGAAQGQWEPGNNDYDVLRSVGQDYYDPNVVAAWRYDGNQWWSYDNVQSIQRKAQYIVDLGLGGGMWWSTDGNRDGTLINTLATALKAAPQGPATDPFGQGTPGGGDNGGGDNGGGDNGGGDNGGGDDGGNTGSCTAAAWSSTAVYTGGQTVSHNGSEYSAKWWTQNNEPGAEQWGPWNLVRACEGGGDNGGGDNGGGDNGGGDDGGTPGNGGDNGGSTAPAWDAGTDYPGGTVVSHGGQTWKNKWWSKGEVPGESEWGPWVAQ